MMVYKNNPQQPISPDSEQYLQQLEQAVHHAATTGSKESSHRLDVERCQSPDGLAGACLELLRRRGWGNGVSVTVGNDQQGLPNAAAVAEHDAVSFYALTTIQRSPLLSCLSSATGASSNGTNFPTLRNQLRQLILATISHPANLQAMPNFVVTKIGVILALLVREEYPTCWPYPWRDVLTALDLSSPNGSSGNDFTINKMASVGMNLSFLNAISDEIVYPAADETDGGRIKTSNYQTERLRREQVKDALRGFPVCETIQNNTGPSEPIVPLEHTEVAHIIGWLLNILKTTSQPQQNRDEIVAIAVRAAATLKRYLSWTDLRLSTNQNLVLVLLHRLGGASVGTIEDPTQRTMLAVECANCLGEIVDRGMEEQKKLALLTELNIFGTLFHLSRVEAGIGIVVDGKLDLMDIDGTQVEAVAAAAELINTSGLALIQGWELDQTSQQTNMQMEHCLELAMSCLAYDSIDVSGAVVELVLRILLSIEKKEGLWNGGFNAGSSNGDTTICDKIFSRILYILHLRMKYEPDFQFDYEDEEEAEEELYRTQLRRLYQRIVRLRPQLALQFVGQCLSSLPQPLSSSPTCDIELALRFVYHYGEGRRPAPGAKTALKDTAFREMIVALHRSDVSSHPHREVILLYYDLSVRYILKDSPEVFALLLGSLSGNRGLQHPHPRVRCRCCYLLLRLIKLMGPKAVRPHVEAVVDGIQGLLFPPAGSATLTIPPDEALYLFEATGILLGTTGLDTELQVRCAAAVLTPHIRSIEQILQSPDLNSDVETFGEQLSMSISAIAQLSKGWAKDPPPEVQNVLAAAVDICRNVVLALPSSPQVRNRTAVLLQRMILCLGEGILTAMPSFFEPLLVHCTLEEDVLDVSQLMNQLCIKFKEKAVAAVDKAVLPFLQKVLAIQLTDTSEIPIGSNNDNTPIGGGGNGISPPPHMITQQLSIRKHAFATLHHIALHNASAVLFSQTNVSSLGDILQLMNDGASTVPDPVMNKTCAQFFCVLIGQWGYCGSGGNQQSGLSLPPPPTDISNSFMEFVYSVFLPSMICSVLDADFNVKDALQCRVLAELGRALWSLKSSSRGNNEFNSRVVETLVLNGCAGNSGRTGSPEIANGFINATSGKDMELVLKAWKR